MFGLGGFEFVLILLFAFLIFGPDKLPEIARTVGKGIAKFRAAQEDMNEVLKESKAFDPNAEDPFGDPTETIDKLASTAEKHMRSAASEASSAVKSKTHEGIDGSSSAKPAAKPAVPKPAAPASASVKNESFTERKARYERERAAKMAAAAEAAESASSEVLDSSNNATDSVEAQRQRQSSNEATEAASSEVADSSKKVEAPTTEEKPAEGGEQ